GGCDQRRHEGGPLSTTIRAGEEPRLPPKSEATQRAFGGIVGQTDSAIVEEGREPGPALQHVVDRLDNRGATRQSGPLGPHPFLKCGNKRKALSPTSFQTLIGGKTIDLSLDVEQGIDAFDRLERNRRDRCGVLSAL